MARFDETQLGFGFLPRAAFAVDPRQSRGRLIDEPASPTRSPFQRDRDRIIHSNAFRRLKHKTQVFISDEGDHYRTRLTHSIEVAQIARALARAFRLDEDLTEALALAHDFGHTPFGHAGERALDAVMVDYGGFDHNLQSLKVVVRMERRYPQFDGLNLTWESLEGLAKHNGPVTGPLAKFIADLMPGFDLKLDGFASLEAQAAAISDDIAYNTHDIDDGLRAGLLTLEQLKDVPLLARILATIEDAYPGLDPERTRHELSRRLITIMVEDVISVTQANLTRTKPQNVDAIRRAGGALMSFSPSFEQEEQQLKRFLFANLYRHDELMRQMDRAGEIVTELFAAYWRAPREIPNSWRERFWQNERDERRKARLIADYIAGMTDIFAVEEHGRLITAG